MSTRMLPPKPQSRPDKVSLLRYILLFRKDIFSAQPAKLYRAWMAEFRTPFFRSFLVNQPDLIKTVLNDRPDDFPKSRIIQTSLETLLGRSVFVTNGEEWKKQRRLIDPAFQGGRLRDVFPAMLACAEDAVTRLTEKANGTPVEIEAQTSHLTADVIFRTLFSIPITDTTATQVFTQFRAYQRTQPLINLSSFVRLPRWMPKFRRAKTKSTSAVIRRLIADLTEARTRDIHAGTAPDDLATKIMTATDPVTGTQFSTAEMVDQVAIFFLAGHETSASALAWALYLLAMDPDMQRRVADEVREVLGDDKPVFSTINKLKVTRNVFRETLRLYPSVPMMLRENTCPEIFRDRKLRPGSLVVLSPFHVHRHTRLWDNPDGFDPDRFDTVAGKACVRTAYFPFSSGSRVCPGAGFAMIEGPLLLAMLVRAFRFDLVSGKTPVPVAHLTLRAKDGIYLALTPRSEPISKHTA